METLRDKTPTSITETHFEDLPFEDAWRYAPFSELIRVVLFVGAAAVRRRNAARRANGAEGSPAPHLFRSLHDPYDWHHGPSAYPK